MTAKPKAAKRASYSNNELRRLLLKYFYDRSTNATSARGAKGVAAKISAIRKDLKASHGLTQQEVWANLTYLISQGWVEEDLVQKSVPLPSGTIIPQATSYYKITAVGTDKIEGPGEFTVDKFKGIRIEATGQNIITVGDGNQVNAEYKDAAGALAELKKKMLDSEEPGEDSKLNVVADIDTIQSQLAKAAPNPSIVRTAWAAIRETAVAAGLAVDVSAIAELLSPFL